MEYGKLISITETSDSYPVLDFDSIIHTVLKKVHLPENNVSILVGTHLTHTVHIFLCSGGTVLINCLSFSELSLTASFIDCLWGRNEPVELYS